jgi:hypothetical protein
VVFQSTAREPPPVYPAGRVGTLADPNNPPGGESRALVVRRTETRHCTDALGLSLASRRLESRPTAAARLVIEASAPSRGLCGGASDEEKRLVDVPVGGSVV